MIYSLSGSLVQKRANFAVIEVGGVGFKVFMSPNALQSLPHPGEQIKIFSTLYSREDSEFELYGFINENELYVFEKLTSVSGVGPKTALGVLSVAKIDQLAAAINEGKSDLLTKVSGIGKKTAERIVLELKGRLEIVSDKRAAAQELGLMESDIELEETLTSLGYTRQQAKKAISQIDSNTEGFKERLKEALKNAKTK